MCYEDHMIMMNVPLDTTNINAINISTLHFRICQHFSCNWNHLHLQKLATLLEVPVTQLYKYIIDTGEPVHSLTVKVTSLMWTVLMHSGTYIGTIGMIFTVSIGVYCFKRFWSRPATLGTDLISQSLHDVP